LQDVQLNEAFKALSTRELPDSERQKHLDHVLGRIDVSTIAQLGLSLREAGSPHEKSIGAGLHAYLLDQRKSELDQLSVQLREGLRKHQPAAPGKYREILSGGIDVRHVENGRLPRDFVFGYSNKETSFKVDPTSKDNSMAASVVYEQALKAHGEEVVFQQGDTVFHVQASQETRGRVFKKTETNVTAWVEDNQGENTTWGPAVGLRRN
jgi:hypothetical protein